jgi:hypothetical protein
MESVPETLQYSLKANNSLVRINAGFDKNPVSTYDYTILELHIMPTLTFPLPVQQILLGFSDETLNKVSVVVVSTNR